MKRSDSQYSILLPDATKFYHFANRRIDVQVCETACPHEHRSPSLGNQDCHECFYREFPELRLKEENGK